MIFMVIFQFADWHNFPTRTMTSCQWREFGKYVRTPRNLCRDRSLVLKKNAHGIGSKGVLHNLTYEFRCFYCKELGVGDSPEVAPKSTMKCGTIRSCFSCISVAWDTAVTCHGDGLWQEDCILVKRNGRFWESWHKSDRVSKWWTVGE